MLLMAEQKNSPDQTAVDNVWSCVAPEMWRNTRPSGSWAMGSAEPSRLEKTFQSIKSTANHQLGLLSPITKS